MHLKEFARVWPSTLRAVVSGRSPLMLTKYNRPYVAVVPAETWAEAEQALEEKRAREQNREAVPV
ncbi:type II toxin-antitoxin system prevent-host-death family antitoxin [Saccharomonospora azurea]